MRTGQNPNLSSSFREERHLSGLLSRFMQKVGIEEISIIAPSIYLYRSMSELYPNHMIKSFCHIVLSRSKNEYADLLNKSLTNCFVIYDSEFKDEEMKQGGFFNLTKTIKSPCSWEKSFYFIEKNQDIFKKFEQIIFVEDDVFSTLPTAIEELSREMSSLKSDVVTHCVQDESDSKEWPHWALGDKRHFEKPIKSFNPLCRLSKRMIGSILEFREKTGMFAFHEILFCSLAHSLGYITIPMESLPFYERHFGRFLYRPIMNTTSANDGRIYHPVKPNYC